MDAATREESSYTLDQLEQRLLLSFDPSKTGAIQAASHSWKAQAGAADSYFIENQRIGYMIAAISGNLSPTSYAKGGEPWAYVPGGRYQFKNGAVPIGTLTVRNIQSSNVTVEKYWVADWDEAGLRTGQKGKWNGVHTDGIYIENTKTLDPDSIFVFEHVEMTEISGGQGLLWERGSARRIHFKDVTIRNRKVGISGRLMMKVDSATRIEEMIFDDVTANVIFMVNSGKLSDILGKVYVHKLSDGQRSAIRTELARRGFPVDDPTRFVTGLPNDLVDDEGNALDRPYSGKAGRVDGGTTHLQAEDYDNGQEGMAYHDTTPFDWGGSEYRNSARRNSDGVDIAAAASGHVVKMAAGEWLDYTIDVESSRMYDVKALLSAGTGTYRVEADGIYQTGDLKAGSGGTIYLPKGEHILQVIAVSGAMDVDRLQLAPTSGGGAALARGPKQLAAVAGGWGALDTSAGNTFASHTTLSWKDVEGERGYLVERLEDGQWLRVGTSAADVTTFSDLGMWETGGGSPERWGIRPHTTYAYRVVAVNDEGERFESAELTVRTGGPVSTAAPAAPTLKSVSADESGLVRVEWADNSTNERGFRIERSTDPTFAQKLSVNGGTTYLSYDLAPAKANRESYVDRGGVATGHAGNTQYALKPGVTYYYRVTAYNSFGHSEPSEVRSVTTPDIAAPGQPGSVAAQAHESGNGGITVTWDESEGAVGGYRIERKQGGSINDPTRSWYVLGIVDAGVTRFTDLALRTSNVVANHYRVVAFNIAGDGAPSAFVSCQTAKSIVPPAPARNLTATGFSTQRIDLSWEDRSVNESGFAVERSVDGARWLQVAVTAADTTEYRDLGLSEDTNYYYRVAPFNTNDTTAQAGASNVASAKTGAARVTEAVSAMALKSGAIELSWAAADADDVGGFIIERAEVGGTFAQIAVLDRRARSFRNTGLRGGTKYCYRVRAVTAEGTSLFSDIATARAVAPSPSGGIRI